MNLSDAKTLGELWLEEHGLSDWRIVFDRSIRRFGMCYFRKKQISLSQHLVSLNDESIVENTILHEIAHALAGAGHGHNAYWRNIALSIGCDGKRCHDASLPEAKYSATCGTCGRVTTRYRKTKKRLACYDCCVKYNNGVFDERFIVIYS